MSCDCLQHVHCILYVLYLRNKPNWMLFVSWISISILNSEISMFFDVVCIVSISFSSFWFSLLSTSRNDKQSSVPKSILSFFVKLILTLFPSSGAKSYRHLIFCYSKTMTAHGSFIFITWLTLFFTHTISETITCSGGTCNCSPSIIGEICILKLHFFNQTTYKQADNMLKVVELRISAKDKY